MVQHTERNANTDQSFQKYTSSTKRLQRLESQLLWVPKKVSQGPWIPGGAANHGGLCCYRILKTTSFHLLCNNFWPSGKTSIEQQRHGRRGGTRSWQCWLCKKFPIYLMCCVHFLTTNLTSKQMSSFVFYGAYSLKKFNSLINTLGKQ